MHQMSTYFVFQQTRALKIRVKTTSNVNQKTTLPSASVTVTITARHNDIATVRVDAKTFAPGSVKTIPTLFVKWTITWPIAAVNQDSLGMLQAAARR